MHAADIFPLLTNAGPNFLQMGAQNEQFEKDMRYTQLENFKKRMLELYDLEWKKHQDETYGRRVQQRMILGEGIQGAATAIGAIAGGGAGAMKGSEIGGAFNEQLSQSSVPTAYDWWE